MKLNLTFRKAAEIMKGKLISSQPENKFNSFVTDSRLVVEQDAFWALKGEKYDARAFIPQALEKGASLIVAEEAGFTVPTNTNASFILVENSLRALQALAKNHRLSHSLKVAAITGSNGKSTTKQMLRAICLRVGETVANMGNFNNQFGVPFSLLEIQPKHQYGVFELGASHKGDIAETACLTLPDVAVITNVSAAHLEFFHDLETVYQTKTEIVQYLNKGGTLVYNADNEYLARLKTAYTGKAISFGFGVGADLQVLETEDFTFVYQGKVYRTGVKLERHDKLNAAAAVAAATALGISMEAVLQGLKTFTPMPMRLERLDKGGIHFILDCYNANPASMQNALSILGREKALPRVAVLGDMKELGESSSKYHRLVAQYVQDNHIEEVFLAGPEMRAAYDVLKEIPTVHVTYAVTPNEWIKKLKQTLKPGMVCLIKASRSMNFENIFKEI